MNTKYGCVCVTPYGSEDIALYGCANTIYGSVILLCTDLIQLTSYGCVNTIYGCGCVTPYGSGVTLHYTDVNNYSVRICTIRMCEYNIRMLSPYTVRTCDILLLTDLRNDSVRTLSSKIQYTDVNDTL